MVVAERSLHWPRRAEPPAEFNQPTGDEAAVLYHAHLELGAGHHGVVRQGDVELRAPFIGSGGTAEGAGGAAMGAKEDRKDCVVVDVLSAGVDGDQVPVTGRGEAEAGIGRSPGRGNKGQRKTEESEAKGEGGGPEVAGPVLDLFGEVGVDLFKITGADQAVAWKGSPDGKGDSEGTEENCGERPPPSNPGDGDGTGEGKDRGEGGSDRDGGDNAAGSRGEGL